MSDRLHIIITGEEQKPHTFMLSKRKLQTGIITSLTLFLCLGIGSFQAARLSKNNSILSAQVAGLSHQLKKSSALQQQYAIQVDALKVLNSSQAVAFEKEKTLLLNSAVSELEERSQMIEQVICNIGVDIKKAEEKTENSGGPFITADPSIGKKLLFRSDRFLETMKYLPLGRPVPGRITSKFGHRKDPVNGRKGFHTGVDMKARRGQKVAATADGTVIKAFTNGGYGRYVEISHGNGYTTKFAHLKKILVKKGDKISRGQTIGLVGNTGRSTGPHLHYEVCLWNKPVNPNKFMQVDKLVIPPVIPQLVAKSTKKLRPAALAARKAAETTALEASHVSL